MHQLAEHTPAVTRQFLLSMYAHANRQLALQGLQQNPTTAVLAQANLSLQTVLDLLRD